MFAEGVGRMSEYPSMYDAAIEYAKKGFAVFPLKYRDKVPLTRNGCKDATTDAAQIKAWWQKYPNANIGLATGSVSQNVFVIDLDIDEDRGIDGYHSLEDWQREHGDFPETWTAITGRGGYHLYYRGNGKIKNRAGIIDGVDIRGNGGYVVAPPSIHTIKLAWAEAVHIWKNEKPQLILPEAYMQEAKELQEANMADDGKRGIIQEYLEGKTQVCAREIWEKALGENVSPRKYQITEINDIIAKVPGWKKLKSPRNFEGYGKQRGFQKTVLQTENEKATNFSEFVPISRQEQMEIPFD